MKLKLVFSILVVMQLAAHGADALFETPVTPEMLDGAALTDWSEGAEKPVANVKGPQHLVWTKSTQPEWNGARFGETKSPGVRHLRVAFKSLIQTGSILVRGGGRLSVLKPGAAYPGNLGDDKEWLALERIGKNGQVVSDEVEQEEYALWVLPPDTSTRALRFTHTAQTADPNYFGWLGGLYVLAPRMGNVATQSVVSASARNEAAAKLANGRHDDWGCWDNGKEGGAVEISKENPETLLFVWPKAVKLSGLNALWAGFGTAEVQSYKGPDDKHPREAADSDWQPVTVADKIQNQYPRSLGVNWIDFKQPVETRALRLRLTQVTKEGHPHLNNSTKKGKRVWLGELFALQLLGNADLKTLATVPPEESHPPIPIAFSLKEAGYVTLVIEDSAGKRVRNLVSETWYPAGNNTAWWDGMDDLLRDKEAARHGIYHIPSQFVQPGGYRVRGIFRKGVELHYEFSGYMCGNPPWPTADHTGGWLTNHTPPSSALFVPSEKAPGGKALVFLGSYVAEGGDGLAWVDLDGHKQGGKGWIGGTWTGAPYLAYDSGPEAAAGVYAYAGAAWEGDLRLTSLSEKSGEKPVVKYKFEGGKEASALNAMAIRNGKMVCSLPKQKLLLFIDAKAGTVLGSATVDSPRGLAFDAQGKLLVLSGTQLQRYEFPVFEKDKPVALGAPAVLASTGLEDPQHIALDAQGNIYVSDRGASHQVKVFSADGKFVKAIGNPGVPKAGPYDPDHMNNPNGIAIDSNNHLWVAETDFQPKRVSIWSTDGKLLNAFYGPAEYGGGGKLDPTDKTRFYFHGMEFSLDWEKGASKLKQVLYRPTGETSIGGRDPGTPEDAIYVDGRRYFSNSYNSSPTNGANVVTIWLDVNGICVPVAGAGRANDSDLLKQDAFKSKWPAGVDLKGDYWKNQAMFCWSDLNGDGKLQPDEVVIVKKSGGSMTVMPDLALVCSRIDGVTTRFAPVRFTDKGVPIYDFAAGEKLASYVQGPTSSGGDQALVSPDGWTVLSLAPKPFAPESLSGVYKGQGMWSYPSAWPGLHASHESPAPDRPGELIGTTRLLGGFVNPKGSDTGPLWCINGNQGNMYLFTADGFFVATLFKDVRQGRPWAMPKAERNMDVTQLTLHDENFWPSITQTSDGKVYLVEGGQTCIVRIDGLETLARLPESKLDLTVEDLNKARAYLLDLETQRQKKNGQDTLTVAMRADAPVVDGKVDDWAGAQWVDIDKSGVAAFFDSKSKPHNVTAAVAVAGEKLYVAWRTNDNDLLRNSGETPNALFKNGGALDLMIGVNGKADPNRGKPVEGDMRLLVTKVKDKPVAMLYRAVVPGTKDPVQFSSPWRTITLDKVEDISAQIQFGGLEGNFEIAIPLALLGLTPQPGMTIRGDAGILRGEGGQTLQRVYWNNKATGITADVPSEAELVPKLWGTWIFKK